MSVKIIPQSVVNTKCFFRETVLTGKKSINTSKFSYKPEDIDWMTQVWIRNYDNLAKNPYNFYFALVLLNRNTRSGKFAIIYNDLVYNAVEKRK